MADKRAVSPADLLRKKFVTLPLTGDFRDLIGEPERSGSWIIYGKSGMGKTTFNLMLAKELSAFAKVEYNTLEEGARMSMQEAVRDLQMDQIKGGRFKILDRMPISELRDRLESPRSAKIIFIDSIQYTDLNKASYKKLLRDFPTHQFIFVSHAKGKQPKGSLAEAVEYDADVKIHVHGYMAFARSRALRGQVPKPFTIWEEGAKKYYETIE